MRFSIDSNVLFYSFQTGAGRTEIAARTMLRAIGTDCILTNQAVGEFLNVARKHLPAHVEDARDVVAEWSSVFPIAPTTTGQLIEASALAESHKLQFWDAVILVVAARAGAEWMLSEDMQDGATINGVRLLNPFEPENAELLDAILKPPPGTA